MPGFGSQGKNPCRIAAFEIAKRYADFRLARALLVWLEKCEQRVRGHAVAIRVPLSNGLINNAKIHQAVTTEPPPFPGPNVTSDYVS
ncbi:hypothetical protein FOXYSP1_17323 [Fusarium oxysporum f. sp. phaseoli]